MRRPKQIIMTVSLLAESLRRLIKADSGVQELAKPRAAQLHGEIGRRVLDPTRALCVGRVSENYSIYIYKHTYLYGTPPRLLSWTLDMISFDVWGGGTGGSLF